MWIIDTSGPTKQVIADVEATQYATFVAGLTAQRDRAKALVTLDPLRADLAGDVAAFDVELAKMDDGDEAMFDHAKQAVLDALAMVPTTHAGVCARAYKNPTDAPRGQTLSISVAGYDVR